MRLDKFLKVSRIIKRRTIANEACDQGKVLINGKSAKASTEVKAGDIIETQFGERKNRYQILSVEEHIAKSDAAGLYQVLV